MRGWSVAQGERQPARIGGIATSIGAMLARVPSWALVLLGAVAVAVGVFLFIAAGAAPRTVFVLMATGLVVSGLGDLLIFDEDRPRPVPMIIGATWVVFGIVIGVWGPRYPVVLIVAAAGLMLLSGFGRILAPLLRGERVHPLTVVRGIVEIAFATIVFFASGTTLDVVAIVFGVRVLLTAVRFFYTALWQRPRADASTSAASEAHPPTRPIATIQSENDGAPPPIL
jgi:uncharacterized membrane protein HdeD (DUF308 family)